MVSGLELGGVTTAHRGAVPRAVGLAHVRSSGSTEDPVERYPTTSGPHGRPVCPLLSTREWLRSVGKKACSVIQCRGGPRLATEEDPESEDLERPRREGTSERQADDPTRDVAASDMRRRA